MESNSSLLNEFERYMLPVLGFRDIVITRGEGSFVWDADGKKILDLNSGQFCSVFGHSDAGVAECFKAITSVIQDTDTATLSIDVLYAAKKIFEITSGLNSRVLFLSTGAEANECCLKYAKHLKEKNGIIAFDQGYHGLTHGTAGYSMSRDRIRPPLNNSYVVRVPRCYYENQLSEEELEEYIAEFENTLEQHADQIAAAIFEPIVSGGGFYFPPKYYFKRIRELCDRYDIFLIFDECQTGFGRTGTWFYYQQLECQPDFIVCAKAIGLGFPVACIIANGNTVDQKAFVMQHFSSHQNEPFAGALVSYGIDRIGQNGLLAANIKKGQYFLSLLDQLANQYEMIQNPRGKGLMCAFDLVVDERFDINTSKKVGEAFCRAALNNGILLQHCNNGKTIRLLPNYQVSEAEIDFFQEKLALTFRDFSLS